MTSKKPAHLETEKNMEVKTVQQKVDLEQLWATELGNFGPYQMRVFAAIMLVVALSGLTPREYIFSAARINMRCLIPECESPGSELQFSPSWILNAVPGTDATTFDSCQRFSKTSTVIDVAAGTCPAELFNQNFTVTCYQHVYENTDTVVYEFDLGCDEWRRTLIGSVRTLGTLVALPITGFIADHWGRRIALAINAFNAGWMGVIRYWVRTYNGYVVSVFFESALGSSILTSGFILLTEIMNPKYRTLAYASTLIFHTIGALGMGIIAWALPNWKHFTLAIFTPHVLIIAALWIIPESIRWSITKGHYEKAACAIRHAASVNGKQMPDDLLITLRQAAERDKASKDINNTEQWLVVLVFRNKRILYLCLTLPVFWITMLFIFYGLSINSVNITGNIYLNFTLVTLVEIPGVCLAALFIGKGRKPVLFVSFLVCAACQFGYIFLPDDNYTVSLTVYLVGKLFISGAGITLYAYTAELYPTEYRHSLFAFCSMMGRVGSIVSPLTPAFAKNVWQHFPYALFGSCSLLSCILLLFTPETVGTKLPDTIEEAQNIGRTPTRNTQRK